MVTRNLASPFKSQNHKTELPFRNESMSHLLAKIFVSFSKASAHTHCLIVFLKSSSFREARRDILYVKEPLSTFEPQKHR